MNARQTITACALAAALGVATPSAAAAGTASERTVIVLAPVRTATQRSLNVAIDVLAHRLDRLGVGGASITRHGSQLEVQVDGALDLAAAQDLAALGELRFRPVLAELPAAPADEPTAVDAASQAAVASCDPDPVSSLPSVQTTSTADDTRSACVVLPLRSGDTPLRLLLAPSRLTGDDVRSAKSRFTRGQGYVVDLNFTKRGGKRFDALAGDLFGQSPPQNQVALVLDGVVQSAPAFQAASFSGDVQISGNFTRSETRDLAIIINAGSLGVELQVVSVAVVRH